MTLRKIQAIELVRRMGSGRSRPGLFRCEDSGGEPMGEYVVKLRGALESGTVGLAFETLAALLANKLGLTVPEAAAIEIEAPLADTIELFDRSTADVVRQSIGLNFGSKYLPGLPVWGVNEPIPRALRAAALEVFAFDALVQNPDRKVMNPNLLVGSSGIHLIDHEAAFSFYYAVGRSPEPWKVAQQAYLRDHVFFSRLRRWDGSLERFQNVLGALTDEDLDAMMEAVPDDWREDRLGLVREHLEVMRDHAEEFVDQLGGMLR